MSNSPEIPLSIHHVPPPLQPEVDAAANLEPTYPRVQAVFVGREVPHTPNDTHLNVLTTQFNSNIFVPAMLLSLLNSLRTNPDITHNVILRPLSTITCIADVTALLCALVIRARLLYLKRRGRAEHFLQDFMALQKFRYGSTILCLHSPLVLIFGVMFLFAGELVGFVMTLSVPQYHNSEPKPWSPAEAGAVWAGVGACVMYFAGATFTAMCLGRKRHICDTIDSILSKDRFCKRDTICKTPSSRAYVYITPPVNSQ